MSSLIFMYSGSREISGKSVLSRYEVEKRELLFLMSVFMKKAFIYDFVVTRSSFNFSSISFRVPSMRPSHGLLTLKTSLCEEMCYSILSTTEILSGSRAAWWE